MTADSKYYTKIEFIYHKHIPHISPVNMKVVLCIIMAYLLLLFISLLLPLPKLIVEEPSNADLFDIFGRKILYKPIIIDVGNVSTDEAYLNVWKDLIHFCKEKRQINIDIQDFARSIVYVFPSLSNKIGQTERNFEHDYYNSYYHITIKLFPPKDFNIYKSFTHITEDIGYVCGYHIVYEDKFTGKIERSPPDMFIAT